MTWVDFRRSLPEPMGQLIWGITRIKPRSPSAEPSKPPNIEKEKVISSPSQRKIMSDARSELIPVANTTNTSRRADVIFVHGINADPRKTWMTDNKLEGFPEESWLYWLGEDIPSVAVWTLGYPANAFAWQGFTMELEKRAENITNLLLTCPGLDNNRPIIFVTHSMGGLLVKYILCRALGGFCTEPDAKSLVERTKGIVFLSTPHTGANLANFIEFVASLFTNPNVSELKKDEPKLLALNQDFCENFDRLDLQVRVFYEKIPTPIRKGIVGNLIRKIVVDEDSATFDRDKMPNVPMTPIDADHSSICWVQSYQFRNQEQLYGNVIRFINAILKNEENSEPSSLANLANNESELEGTREVNPKDSSKINGDKLNGGTEINEDELLDTLERITPAQFAKLVFKLKVPKNLMPGADKPQTERAIALLSWAEAPGGCGPKKIKQALDELLA